MAQKATQAEAQYGKGDPLKHCGTCRFYRWHRCAQVMGNISPFGVCVLNKPDINPFGQHLTANEASQIRTIFERSEATQPQGMA